MTSKKNLSDFTAFKLENPELVKGGTTGTYNGTYVTVNYGYGSTSATGVNGGTGTAYYGAAQITGVNGNSAVIGGAAGTATGSCGITVTGAAGGILKY